MSDGEWFKARTDRADPARHNGPPAKTLPRLGWRLRGAGPRPPSRPEPPAGTAGGAKRRLNTNGRRDQAAWGGRRCNDRPCRSLLLRPKRRRPVEMRKFIIAAALGALT